MAKQPASDCPLAAKEDAALTADTEGTAMAEGVGEFVRIESRKSVPAPHVFLCPDLIEPH